MSLTISSTFNHFLPTDVKSKSLDEQYDYILKFSQTHKSVSLVSSQPVGLFGPFVGPLWVFNECDFEDMGPELQKVNEWVTNNILVNLSRTSDKTLDVLIRIATGMMNKCNIRKEYLVYLQSNMVENLWEERKRIVLSQLPF